MLPDLRQADPRLAPVTDCAWRRSTRSSTTVIESVDQALVALVAGEGDGSRTCAPRSTCSPTRCCSHLSYEERALVEPLARYGAH